MSGSYFAFTDRRRRAAVVGAVGEIAVREIGRDPVYRQAIGNHAVSSRLERFEAKGAGRRAPHAHARGAPLVDLDTDAIVVMDIERPPRSTSTPTPGTSRT